MRYVRARERDRPLPLSTKFFQGLGALPDTWKNFAFNTFVLFYYNQVLELPAAFASLAIMIALVLDAISDPLVGSLSDQFRSRLGRRHPFMYAAAAPLGATLFLLFAPPAGLGQWGLFAWLTTFAVLVRTAMTFFVVPWNALFAEFSDDYVERTTVVTYRYLVGWTGGVAFSFLVWSAIFPSTPAFTPGHLDPDAYGTFALVLGVAVTIAALGAGVAFAVVVPLQRRFDKKRILLTCLVANVLDGMLVVNLRLFDLLPTNGEPLLLGILIASSVVSAGLATITGIVGASMVADTLDEQELITGRRQEGVFSAALSFSGKITSGFNVFAGGLLLQYALAFPAGARPGALDPDLVLRLGLVAGILVPLCNAIPILIVRRYELTRERYTDLRAQLARQRDGAPT